MRMPIFVLLLHPNVACKVRSAQSSDGQLGQALPANAVESSTPRVGLCRWDVFLAVSPVFAFCRGPESRADLSVRQSLQEQGMARSYCE